MAYPTPPGRRIGYDLDGTVGLVRDGLTSIVWDIDPGAMNAMNSEGGRIAAGGHGMLAGGWVTLVFPVPMRIRGIWAGLGVTRIAYANGARQYPVEISTSLDSTNGVDGVWTDVVEVPQAPSAGDTLDGFIYEVVKFNANDPDNISNGYDFAVNDFYLRDESENGIVPVYGAATRQVHALKVTPVGSLPVTYYNSWSTHGLVLHVYGEPDTTAGGRLLQFWSPSLDTLAGIDEIRFGDVGIGSSGDRTFRVKNSSDTESAVNVQLSVEEAGTESTPTAASQILLSDDGVTWGPTITIPLLSPGSISAVITARRTTPLDADLGNWAPRILAAADSWS